MKFSKDAFRAWLEAKTDLTRVGKPEDTMHCPLCLFMKDQGAKKVQFQIHCRTVDGKNATNPIWARQFQSAACNFVENDDDRQITAKRALSFLS